MPHFSDRKNWENECWNGHCAHQDCVLQGSKHKNYFTDSGHHLWAKTLIMISCVLLLGGCLTLITLSIYVQVGASMQQFCSASLYERPFCFSGQHGRKHPEQNRAHIQTRRSLQNSLWRTQQKLPRDPGGFLLFRTGLVPLSKSSVRLFFFMQGVSTGTWK